MIPKWWQTMKVVWSNLMVYKFNFILQSIAPLLVFLFVKVSLWSAIFSSTPEKQIGIYSLEEMLTYHLWIMLVTMISIGSANQDISQDIRLGRITTYLIYPFSLFEFHMSSYLAKQLVKVIIAFLTLMGVWLALGLTIDPRAAFQALLLAFWGGLFWFFLNYFFGLLGFWLEETWTFSVMIQVITYFFSGAIIPLELYPEWLRQGLIYTPFPYIGYIPAKIMMGGEVDLTQAFLVLTGWIILTAWAGHWIFKRGLRLYTAAIGRAHV